MFDFLKSKKEPKHVEALTNQTIGGQSVLYRLFRQGLGVDDSHIRKLELTYFAASVTTFVYLHLSNDPNKERVLDAFSHSILEKSIASAGEHVSLSSAIAQYQQRFAEYSTLIPPIFDPGERPSPEVTLLLHVFASVTGGSAQGHMIQISAAAGLITQYIADHIDFVKVKL